MAPLPSDDRISGSRPKKQFKFPDVYLPADVVKAVSRKRITPTGFTILMVVRALTLQKDWCWASNAYFAKACRRTTSEVSRNIQKLVRQGYLIQSMKNNRRNLQLAWSWALRKTARGLAENRKGPLRKTANINIRRETKETNSRPLTRDRRESEPSASMDMTRRFYNEVDAWMEEEHIGGCKPARIKGPFWFQKTIKKQGHAITEEVLAWTLENLNDPYVPEVRSAKSFYDKFDRLVLAKRRSKQKLIHREDPTID